MPKYVYLTSSVGADGWVKDGKFEPVGPDDSPHKYDEKQFSQVKARHYRLNALIANPNQNLFTMKFDYSPPYLYHGLVQ